MPITLIGKGARRTRRRRPAAGEAEPHDPHTPRPLRLLTLNVAHARRQARHQALLAEPALRRNLQAIAQVLRREAADVVALQEADGPSAWSGGFD
ncbi:MAG: endonuclease/exonuclease/phosphatase family protein, partial [Myxococcota bacterium]